MIYMYYSKAVKVSVFVLTDNGTNCQICASYGYDIITYDCDRILYDTIYTYQSMIRCDRILYDSLV